MFNIGKGTGSRATTHPNDVRELEDLQLIQDIRKQHLEARVRISSHALPDQETDLLVEAAAIDLLGATALRHVGRRIVLGSSSVYVRQGTEV